MKSNSLNFLYLNLTFRCNHNCIFCVSDETVKFRKQKSSQELSLEMIKTAIDNLPSNIDTVHISGGEPTLHKDFLDILLLLKARFSRIQIASNGAAFADFAFLEEVLKRCSPQFIIPIFSLDPAIHQGLTGKDSLKKILSGLANISSAQKEKKCTLLLKLLLLKQTINTQVKLLDELESYSINPIEIIVSGLCRTDGAIASSSVIPFNEARPFISDLARKIIDRGWLYCFHRIPLCAFEEELWPYFMTLDQHDRFDEYANAISLYPSGEIKEIPPNRLNAKECESCDLIDYCEFASSRNRDSFDYSHEFSPISLQKTRFAQGE